MTDTRKQLARHFASLYMAATGACAAADPQRADAEMELEAEEAR